jgi:hypothetical protein
MDCSLLLHGKRRTPRRSDDRLCLRESRRLDDHEDRAPMSATLRQGDAIARPSRLGLRVDAEAGIFVTGSVIELGSGHMEV